jgi:hypothetical protein
LWVLVAAALLIGAGFGAAETVYQLAVERANKQQADGKSLSARSSDPTRTAVPTVTPGPSPTATSRPVPAPRPTATPQPSPTLPPFDPSSTTPGDVGALAPSLISAERHVLARLDDPTHYILDVVVDFETLTVAGTAEIFYTNNEPDPLDAIYLRLYPNADHYDEGETRIDAVNVDGDAAAFTFQDAARTILEVPLPVSLTPDAETKLQIAFTVTVPRRSDRFGYDQGVMSLGHWYPVLAVYDDEGWNLDPYVALGDAFYSDVAFYTVHVTVPEETVIAATGVEVGRILHRPPIATITYVSGATRDFALALSRRYRTVSTQIDETTVTSYYLPGHEEGGRQALQVAADALEVYNQRFGQYPYTELDVAETAFTVLGAPGGMEFPGVVFISSEFYRPRGLFASELDVVVAHEVAHQWWYGVVGNNQVDEPWLDEAFATLSSIVYVEDRQDAVTAEAVKWSQLILPYQLVRMLGGDGPVQSSLLDYSGDLISYQSIVYSKGALFLTRLRELLGDDDFFALLQYHYQTHKYGLLTADSFRRSIEAAGNGDASSTPRPELDEEELAEVLALYDAVVVRGEPLKFFFP